MIDYNELEQALAKMKPRQRLYELVKKEMQKRGHWKYLKRGFHVNKASTQYIYNQDKQVVMIQGLLPNGSYGIVADEARPFTEAELRDATLYNLHIDDLNKRIGV